VVAIVSAMTSSSGCSGYGGSGICIEELIGKHLQSTRVDLESLKKIARSKGGFQTNEIRKRVWPKLLDINRYNIDDYGIDFECLNHKDLAQVLVDVDRSLWNFEHVLKWDRRLLEVRRKCLLNIMMSVLCKNPSLNYFQGFHDIVTVFMLVLQDDNLVAAVVEKVCNLFFRDFLLPDFEVVGKSMSLIMYLLKIVDEELFNFLQHNDVQSYFATSWIITWFAHDIKDINKISRLYDSMLCSPPYFSMYVSAALLIHNRESILHCEQDFGLIHNHIVHILEKGGMDVEDVIAVANTLLESTPISRLIQSIDSKELKRIIRSKKLSLIREATVIPQYVLPDWVLLERLDIKSGDEMENTGDRATFMVGYFAQKSLRRIEVATKLLFYRYSRIKVNLKAVLDNSSLTLSSITWIHYSWFVLVFSGIISLSTNYINITNLYFILFKISSAICRAHHLYPCTDG